MALADLGSGEKAGSVRNPQWNRRSYRVGYWWWWWPVWTRPVETTRGRWLVGRHRLQPTRSLRHRFHIFCYLFSVFNRGFSCDYSAEIQFSPSEIIGHFVCVCVLDSVSFFFDWVHQGRDDESTLWSVGHTTAVKHRNVRVNVCKKWSRYFFDLDVQRHRRYSSLHVLFLQFQSWIRQCISVQNKSTFASQFCCIWSTKWYQLNVDWETTETIASEKIGTVGRMRFSSVRSFVCCRKHLKNEISPRK